VVTCRHNLYSFVLNSGATLVTRCVSRCWWTVLLTVAGNVVAAQSTCSTLVNRYPRFAVGMGPLWEELYAKADEVTLEAFKKRLVEGPRPNERVDVTGPAANELQRSVETDSARRRVLAEVLTWLMQGESIGFVGGQDLAALDIYRRWDLPLGPAAKILADPTKPARARYLAARVFEVRPTDPDFRDAALAALCALATKAEAMRALGIDPEGVGAARLLDNDELALLASLETGIAVAGERSGKRLRFEEVLSSENPVTQHLRRRLR